MRPTGGECPEFALDAISDGRFGKWIGANQNRRAAGLKLVAAGVSAGRAR